MRVRAFINKPPQGDFERVLTMKMNTKLALVAGALAFSVAGQANAAIVAGGTLANNLVLSVWDATNMTSYTANLGVTMQSFLTGAGFVAGGTAKAPVLTGVDTAANNFTFTDGALSAYLATASANTTWSVVASNAGVYAYGTNGALTTSATPLVGMSATVVGITGAQVAGTASMNTNYLATVNLNNPTAVSYTTTAATGGLAYVGAASNGMGNNFSGQLPTSNMAAVGQAMNFYFLTPTQNARAQYVNSAVYNFANATGASTWSLAANGTLTYAVAAPVVAAVPEPGEWALMLSGLALIGFIASRRKEENSVTFA